MTQHGRRQESIEHGGKVLNVTIQHNGTFSTRDGRRWDHESYTFFHRNPVTGATFQSRFYAGIAYGTVNPWDALSANFLDARFLQEEYSPTDQEGLAKVRQGEAIEARLRRFLGEDYDYWVKVDEEVWNR